MATKKTAAKAEKPVKAEGAQAEKLKALEHALADLDKQFGKGSVMKLGETAGDKNIPVIPTGCLTLDAALGVGGIGGSVGRGVFYASLRLDEIQPFGLMICNAAR